MPAIEEHTGQVAGLSVLWRSAPAEGAPVLYLHGVPSDGGDWVPFLERTGGIAPDLPGFGRSDKPPTFDYSIPGYDAFLEAFLDALGLDRVSLVVHDWGVVGLALAQRLPERIERLVVIDAVPLLPGYRWHRVARLWRTRVAGELAMGFTTRWALRLFARRRPAAMPPEYVPRIWESFDQGTQRAILRLYRSAPPETLAAAGASLGRISAPALVVWGAADPYLPTRFAEDYARELPDARLEVVPGAGHWPWLDSPGVVELVAAHVAAR